jgi:hypothetical protein
LDSNDPFLVAHTYGRGTVLQLAAPLNADWSTLPAKNDFVPFLHEMVFHLASRTSSRNVEPGMPLVLNVPDAAEADQYRFLDSEGNEYPAERSDNESRPQITLTDTQLPGIYRALKRDASPAETEYFVVNFDRRESDLALLAQPAEEQLASGGRIQFIDSLHQMQQALLAETAPSELWRWMLLLVLAILVGEVLLTRRLVQGGHESVETEQVAETGQSPEWSAASTSGG